MRKAARVVIIQNQNILLIKRDKFGLKYYTLPGGEIEMGETADQAGTRELYEETNIKATPPKLIYVEDAGDMYGTQYIFTADYQDGEAKMRDESIEAELNKNGQNLYHPVWVPVSKFAQLPFRSTVLQNELLKGMRDGWPSEPQMLKSQAEISNK